MTGPIPPRKPKFEIDPNSEEFGAMLSAYKNALSSIEIGFNRSLMVNSGAEFLITTEFFSSEKTLERLTKLNNNISYLFSLMEDFAYEIGEAYFTKIMYLKFNNLPNELVIMLDGFTLDNLDKDGWNVFTDYVYGESNGLQIARLVETDTENPTLYQKYASAIAIVGGNVVLNKFQTESSVKKQ